MVFGHSDALLYRKIVRRAKSNISSEKPVLASILQSNLFRSISRTVFHYDDLRLELGILYALNRSQKFRRVCVVRDYGYGYIIRKAVISIWFTIRRHRYSVTVSQNGP